MTEASAATYEAKYKSISERREKSIAAIRMYNGKLDPEENSDDDMYSRDYKFLEGKEYDVLPYDLFA